MSLHALSEFPLVSRLGWTILHSLWEVLAVAAVLALVLPALRRWGPRAAYAGGCLALALCLLLPVVTFSLLPGSPADRDNSTGTMASAVSPSVAVQDGTPSMTTANQQNSAAQEIPFTVSQAASEQASTASSQPAPFQVRAAEMIERLNVQLAAWLPELVLAWIAGVCLLSLWNCGAWLTVQRLKSATSATVAQPLEEAARRIARQLGLVKAVRLAQSTLVDSPMVIGAWKPVILLPASLVTELSPDQLESLLAHELAHVLRRDYLINLLQTAIETLLFYHPGVWWISAQVRNERELCCDDLAVRIVPNRAVYVRALAAVAGVRTSSLVSAAAGGQLLPRLQRLLGITRRESAHPARWLTGALILSLCGLFAVISALPVRTATAEMSGDSKPDADPALLSETGEFELHIVDPDGQPIPEATVEIRTNPMPLAEHILRGRFVKKSTYGPFVTTDAQGRLKLKLPPTQKRLDVNITTPGYGPYWAAWSSENHEEPIPATFTAELDAGWSVGGIVVDEEGRPVAGVAIHPSIKFKKRPGDLDELHVGTNLKTDAEGQWRFDSVPASKEEVFAEISHADFMPLRRPLTKSEFGIERNQQPAGKIVLDRGLTVTGKVTDDTGKPIAGALVRTKFSNDLREARSNADGEYELHGCEARTARIVVSAKGRATDMQEVKIDAEMEPVDFQMQPGGKIRIQVLDQAGNPVPKARIFFQRWRGDRFSYFEFDHVGQYADDKGIWEWNEAPLDEFGADICPPDGMELGSQPLIARVEPYVFRTPPALVITGRVLDAETKQPIPKFRVVPGVRYESGRLGWMNREQFDAADGKYRLRQTHHRDAYLVRIEADGYQGVVSRDIQYDEGAVTVDFELMKGVEVAGTILTPEGAPAAGAQVALGVAGSQISIKNGEFDGQTYCEQQTADQEGRFKFPPQETAYQLVILHSSGYAHLKAAPDELPATITLDAWARVEGTFHAGQKPVPNAKIEIHSSGLHSYGEDVPRIFTQHNVTADAEGRYKFPRVIPGKAAIGRRILLTVENGAEDITSSCRIPVTFAAGELTQLDLGGTGRPVIGKLQPPKGFDGRVNWNFALIYVQTGLTPPPMPNGPQIPDDVNQDPLKRAAWMTRWQLTDEGRVWTEWKAVADEIQRRRDASPTVWASVDRDGMFLIDDMPVGSYNLSVRFDRNGPGGLQDYRFTVPPMEGDRSDEQLDLGVLRLER